MSPHIEQIQPELTWHIRHQVLYPEKELKDIKLADDEDGIHFGLFDNNQLIGVVSWFKRGKNAQFRKLAVLNQFQKSGYGTLFMEHVIAFSKTEGAEMLWCNSRQNTADFYKRFGFNLTDNTFNKDGRDFVIMELPF
jgi:N-acetylglutamate synthase-like GNAT family acetyltransferase